MSSLDPPVPTPVFDALYAVKGFLEAYGTVSSFFRSAFAGFDLWFRRFCRMVCARFRRCVPLLSELVDGTKTPHESQGYASLLTIWTVSIDRRYRKTNSSIHVWVMFSVMTERAKADEKLRLHREALQAKWEAEAAAVLEQEKKVEDSRKLSRDAAKFDPAAARKLAYRSTWFQQVVSFIWQLT